MLWKLVQVMAHLLKFCARYALILRIALVDIAPQLYIAEQRCKAIFGDASQGSGSVVGFRTTTNMKTIDLATFKAGTIAIVAPWQCDSLRNVWLGINHASMQEMTRAQAARYIATLESAHMEYFYLINYHPGVIGSPDEAVSSDFLVDQFSQHGFSIKVHGPNNKAAWLSAANLFAFKTTSSFNGRCEANTVPRPLSGESYHRSKNEPGCACPGTLSRCLIWGETE